MPLSVWLPSPLALRRELDPRKDRPKLSRPSMAIPGYINEDGTWKGDMDSSIIPNANCPDDEDFYSNVQDDEYYYALDYSCVCTVDNKLMRASCFY